MRFLRFIAVTWLALICALGPARAEKRVALVIGNDRYANLPAHEQLQKAANDARAVGDSLKSIGFEVIAGENLDRRALNRKLGELVQRLNAGDTALFFFSGHGVALDGVNYILPADVPDITAGQETLLKGEAIGETYIISELTARGVRVAVIILDACRTNPFSRPGGKGIGVAKGLAPPPQVQGVFSLYAARSGQAALDRLYDGDSDPNSVFSRVLAPMLRKPGVNLRDLAYDVREEVARIAKTAGYDQQPEDRDGTIGGRVYLAGLTPGVGQLPKETPVRAEVIRKVKPAVVAIQVKGDQGSGFFISADGYAITPNHLVLEERVIEKAGMVEVMADDGKKYTAKVVARDRRTNIALLKVEGGPFPFASFSEAVPAIGDRVLIIGSQFGLGGSVTAGIVSALERNIGGGNFDDFIQIDAPIHRSYVGGLAVDMEGNVIGVTIYFNRPSNEPTGNYGLALPAGTVKRIVTQLKEKGAVTRGAIGLRVMPVTQEIADSVGLKEARGVRVVNPDANGPAAKAGIEDGDVIIAVNGKDIADMRHLRRTIWNLSAGTAVQVTVMRNGRQKTFDLTAGVLPD